MYARPHLFSSKLIPFKNSNSIFVPTIGHYSSDSNKIVRGAKATSGKVTLEEVSYRWKTGSCKQSSRPCIALDRNLPPEAYPEASDGRKIDARLKKERPLY